MSANENKKATKAVTETSQPIAETLRIAMKKAGKTDEQIDKMFTRNVGTNGEIPGTKYTLTGEIEVISEAINGNSTVYFALNTEQGKKLSLQSIMSLSSLSGYVFDVEHEQQFYNDKDEDDDNPIIETKVFKSEIHSTYCKNIGTEETPIYVALKEKIEEALPKLPTRNLVELATIISNNPELLQGVKLTYIGKAIRPYTAKKDSPDVISTDRWLKGYKRVMITQLWAWTYPKKEAK